MDLFRFWRIFWVDATTAETIKLSVQDIAADPDARVAGVEGSAESVLRWLSRVDFEWLIIFDNAGDDPRVVSGYFPGGNRGNILFTSRNQALRRYVSPEACAEVEKMEEDDAISLLLKSALLDESSEGAKQASRLIVKELCFLPLAVDQAGAAIANGLCNVGDYLQMYLEHRKELLAYPMFGGASNYGRAVYGSWDLSFEAIKARDSQAGRTAIFILQMFAFFHHENIGEEIFKAAAEAAEEACLGNGSDSDMDFLQDNIILHQVLQLDKGGNWDPLFFREGIQVLLSFSLIKKAAIGNTYSVHPLVHSWSHDRMLPEEQWIKYACSHILSSSISFQFTSEHCAFRQRLLPHIKVNLHDIQLEMPSFYNDKQYTNFALVFYEGGYWKDAEEL